MTNLVQLVAGDDPFLHNPDLYSIWDPEKSALAAQYAREDAYTGQVYTIEDRGTVIGVTGWFTDHPEDAPHVCRLRWTGVCAPYRRQGHTTQAIMQLVPKIKAADRGRYTILIESIPVNEKQGPLLAFFTGLGFVMDGVPYSQSWTEHQWQDLALTI